MSAEKSWPIPAWGDGVGRSILALLVSCTLSCASSGAEPTPRVYDNRLTAIPQPEPILSDFPRFVAPIVEEARFRAPPIIEDVDADLEVRAWRFSYNARGIIEMTNRLRGERSAIVVVHPWGLDDGQGWRTPEPAGVALFCTPRKNQVYLDHLRAVVNPFLSKHRPHVACVGYSLPGREDPIRKKLYRSIRGKPNDADRRAGARQLAATLNAFRYVGEPLQSSFELAHEHPVRDYFRQFPSLDAGARFNGAGFWDLPIPVARPIDLHPEDVVIYDGDGYPPLRDFLKGKRIRHILLAGYATDMCLCKTTAGYENLEKDFNVLIVGDATLATYPGMESPRICTTASLVLASREHLITQVSWVRRLDGKNDATGAVRR